SFWLVPLTRKRRDQARLTRRSRESWSRNGGCSLIRAASLSAPQPTIFSFASDVPKDLRLTGPPRSLAQEIPQSAVTSLYPTGSRRRTVLVTPNSNAKLTADKRVHHPLWSRGQARLGSGSITGRAVVTTAPVGTLPPGQCPDWRSPLRACHYGALA